MFSVKIDKSLKDVGVSNNSKLVFLNNKQSEYRGWNLLQFHYHEVYEVLFCLDASEVTCCVENKIFDMEPGSVFVFSPYTLHKTTTTENSKYHRFVIYFNASDLLEFSKYSTNILSRFSSAFTHIRLNDNEINEAMSILENEPDGDQRNAELKDRLKLFRFMLYLSEKEPQEDLLKRKDSKHDELNNILEYIQNNLSDADLTLTSIAKKFYMSTTSINTMFKKYINSTVKEYIILKRISMAEDLLTQDYSVSEVCERVGFNNYSHFIRTFTKVVGIPPKQFSRSKM